MSTTFRAWSGGCGLSFCSESMLLLFQQPWVMKVIPLVLPRITLRNCQWQFPSEQTVLTNSERESIVLKLDQKRSKMERQN